MSLAKAAAVFVAIEILLGVLAWWSTRRLARRREAAGLPADDITMGSSPALVLYFLYHLPMIATFVPSGRFGQWTKAIAVYLGTPLMYLTIFALTGRRGLGWHPW